jgi:hypothetical protein
MAAVGVAKIAVVAAWRWGIKPQAVMERQIAVRNAKVMNWFFILPPTLSEAHRRAARRSGSPACEAQHNEEKRPYTSSGSFCRTAHSISGEAAACPEPVEGSACNRYWSETPDPVDYICDSSKALTTKPVACTRLFDILSDNGKVAIQ